MTQLGTVPNWVIMIQKGPSPKDRVPQWIDLLQKNLEPGHTIGWEG